MAVAQQSVYDQPAYSTPHAAHILGLKAATLRTWAGPQGLLVTPAANAISFNNLAEAHVLKAMRRTHRLPLQRIRKALKELCLKRQTSHPLLDETFETDGVHLCIRDREGITNLSRHSQKEIGEVVSLYLRRIQRDKAGRVTSLFPFVVADREDEPRSISISPTVSFGKPVLAGTGISTSVIVGRFNARDSIQQLAHEYQVQESVLEDAIRWELSMGKAA